jgi:hypothetical protein
MRGPSGPLWWTVRDIRESLGQKLFKNIRLHYGPSDGEASTVRRPSADRLAPGADRPVVVKLEKLEGDRFDKIHF